jgi:DNA-binding NarL/FixJ family response regulator
VLAQINASPIELPPFTNDCRFSDREKEILELLSQGLNNKEISQQLYITGGTVKNHISRILAELGMRDRTQAALWAQKYFEH